MYSGLPVKNNNGTTKPPELNVNKTSEDRERERERNETDTVILEK